MKLTVIGAAALIFAAPVLAHQPEAEQEAGEAQAKADDAKDKSESTTIVIPEVKEEKRICRRVKLDMSSRRATKVCKTSDEWREFNQRR